LAALEEPRYLLCLDFLDTPEHKLEGLRFTLPIIRLVLPLDGEKLCASSVDNSSSLRPQTLLRLIRIETPLEDLLPAKASPSTRVADQISPPPTPKKKSNRSPKTPRAACKRRPSPGPKKK
jgi:hypothetical protein